MKHISKNLVEFNDREAEIKSVFDDLLDHGLGITDAARAALSALPVQWTEPAFVDYLSDGTLHLTLTGEVTEV